MRDPRRGAYLVGTPGLGLAVALLSLACGAEPQAAGPVTTAAPPAPPQVVALDPPQGAVDVDPNRDQLAVRFDRPMDPEGWSWVIEGPETAPDLGTASFDAEGRTNTVVARLQPGRTYVVWINSARYSYFRDHAGTPATPLRWTFSTRAPALAAASAVSGAAPGPPASAPRPVRLEPANGATGVDPSTTVLRATFDRPMEASWSWVTEGHSFPETTGQAYFEPDGRTAALPVRLAPGRTYVLWLNSAQYRLFRDLAGVPAEPLRWQFSTAPR
jgi:hypothetical protein